MIRVAFSTFGCKVNQFDTALMTELAGKGPEVRVVAFEDAADVYVVNSCTVTERSDQQVREVIRRAIRGNPAARVIVTGCYAQRAPAEVAAIPGVSLVLGTDRKKDLPLFLKPVEPKASNTIAPKASSMVEPKASNLLAPGHPRVEVGPIDRRPIEQPIVRTFPGRTRAFVKIQEGCDDACTFCIIPRTRGPERSLPVDRLLAQVRALEEEHGEVVFTGVQLGRYGCDLDPPTSLADLLRLLLRETAGIRFRLSSIDPRHLSDRLLDLIAAEPRLCPSLHIPLQSGSEKILARMDRGYTAGWYGDLILKTVTRIPGIALATDVMVGFPGEGDGEFEETHRLLSELPLASLHVFPFSIRPGTLAATMTEQVPEPAKRERVGVLRRVGQEKGWAFRRSLVGQTLSVLVEAHHDPSDPPQGLSENYVRVTIVEPKASHKRAGTATGPGRNRSPISVYITGVTGTGVTGMLAFCTA